LFRAQESGQDDPDVLFLYGKALFQVAQKNSQVLGGAPVSDPSFGMTHAPLRLIQILNKSLQLLPLQKQNPKLSQQLKSPSQETRKKMIMKTTTETMKKKKKMMIFKSHGKFLKLQKCSTRRNLKVKKVNRL
jgi:hypothetical protein